MFTDEENENLFEINFSQNSLRNYLVFSKTLMKDKFKHIVIEHSSYLNESEVLLLPGFKFYVCQKSTANFAVLRENSQNELVKEIQARFFEYPKRFWSIK